MVPLDLGSTLQVPEGAGKPDKQAGSANLLRCGVKRVDGLLKHPQGSIALWCVHANVEVLQAFKQVVQYCQAKGNLQNGKPALKVAFR